MFLRSLLALALYDYRKRQDQNTRNVRRSLGEWVCLPPPSLSPPLCKELHRKPLRGPSAASIMPSEERG